MTLGATPGWYSVLQTSNFERQVVSLPPRHCLFPLNSRQA